MAITNTINKFNLNNDQTYDSLNPDKNEITGEKKFNAIFFSGFILPYGLELSQNATVFLQKMNN